MQEQHVQPLEPEGIHGEEVARDDPGGLLAQERPPRRGGPSWGRVKSVAAQRGADCGRRDLHTKPQELALDALVAPARVLSGEADDQLLHAMVQRRSPVPATRVGPGASDHASVPAQQRLRSDAEQGVAQRTRCRLADRPRRQEPRAIVPGS
jgi:hypothetical protein